MERFMKFVSFNINGLRAHSHQLAEIITLHQPEVIGLQETKVHDDIFPLKDFSQYGYHAFYHGQKSHYGVALLTKIAPLVVRYGFPTDKKDAQRRIIMADLDTAQGALTVINAYFPQGESRDHPIKFPNKARFYKNLQNYLEQKLSIDRQVLIMGDMNISHSDLDIGIGEKSRKRWLYAGKCSFLPEERKWMNCMLNWGLVDTYRCANPTRSDEFSWFSYRANSFKENRGLRIDLLLATPPLAALCTASGVDYKIRSMEKPSDHAPVWSEFSL